MSWEQNLLPMIRLYIDDVDTPQSTSDARLKEIAAIAAFEVNNEVEFSSTYIITLNPANITPDPTTDTDFCVLVSNKAACLIARSEFKAHGLNNMTITDGASKIEAAGIAESMKARYDDLCNTYEELKNQFILGKTSVGKVVAGPVVYENIPPIQGNI